MTRLTWVLAALPLSVLLACSNNPPAPDWAVNAQGGAQRAVAAYLGGNMRVARLEQQRARDEVASTAAPERLARLELVFCALEVASAEFNPCPGYQRVAQDAAAPERAYARYLLGQATATDAALLPEAHRALVTGTADATGLSAVADPLSRLVAAGVLLRRGRATPGVFTVAVDTASAQGWRRPLLAWLKLAQQQAQAAGQTEEAARLQRRLDLLMRDRS